MKRIEFSKSQPILVTLALLQVALVGYFDYRTGPDVTVSIFYLFPIFLAVFALRRKSAIAVSILCGLVWCAADLIYVDFQRHFFLRIWNALVGLNFFLIILYLFVSLRRERIKEKEIMEFIVHDLRSPLSNVIVGLKLLEKMSGESLGDSEKAVIKASISSGNWMLSLVNSLLDLTQMEAGLLKMTIEEVAARDLIREAVQQVALLAESKEIEIIVCVDPDDTKVRVDRNLTVRVLVNLLGNAIKFTPSRKHVTIEAMPRCDRMLIFSVSDEGPGIAPDLAAQVFDKYVHADLRKEGLVVGSGLGLTFCRMGVEAQKGEIRMESIPEGGTRVVFTLPRA